MSEHKKSFLTVICEHLPLVIALVALAGSMASGFASYSVLAQRVENNEKQILQNTQQIQKNIEALYAHMQSTTIHVDMVRDARDRDEILRRLDRIEQILLKMK